MLAFLMWWVGGGGVVWRVVWRNLRAGGWDVTFVGQCDDATILSRRWLRRASSSYVTTESVRAKSRRAGIPAVANNGITFRTMV